MYVHACTGNEKTTYYELSSIYGHDTFMLDVNNVGAAVKVCCGQSAPCHSVLCSIGTFGIHNNPIKIFHE